MNIEPISELKNYNTLLNGVKDGSPIYLTKNGKGLYAIMTISDANEYEKYQVNKEFKNNLKADVTNEDFFIKDIESLNKKLIERHVALVKDKKNKVDHEDMSMFLNRLRKKIESGKI